LKLSVSNLSLISGLIGGSTSKLRTFSQSTEANQGCLWISAVSWAPMRLLGSLFRHWLAYLDDEVLQLVGDFDALGECGVEFDDPVEHGVLDLVVEWRQSDDHFVQ
jgi:hypothetical protein